ncbi:hypothetical protein AAFC00_005517 [Neodothiora populina]|uniref:RNA polymerase-associated protein LEO1 n=1 Tax=Neodothiora populina TaxID=2781224 RepID=A0ABR3PL65_9PEZI
MASAAAVAADQALSPDPTNIAEPDGITTAILPSDEKVPDDLNQDDDDDDDDEDIVVRSRPRGPQMNGAPEEEEELGDEDDLFGDEDEDEADAPAQQRTLDDADLDSGDDEGRHDRVGDGEEEMRDEEEEEERTLAVMEAGLGRQPLPEPSDGEMYLTKVPRFLSIDPKVWNLLSYQPPTADHSGTTGQGFSPYNTAMSTVHWRRSPSDPTEIQSNARILRWSDGSFTLQFASNPTQQFVIEGNPLAPRQQNPPKPTPTSRKAGQKEHGYDTFTYLTIPDTHNQLLRITHKITAGLSILPSAETTDEALEKLQNSLAAIAQGKNKTAGGNIELVQISEDPDLARQKAEVAEREKMRAQKRREAAETRERERGGRGFGRSRTGGYGGGGLSAAMLEDDEMGGSSRPRGNKPKQNRRQRRNSEYSEDEDFGHKRGNFANDEYDEEDEFIARSDEEEEAVASSDDDDGIVEEPRRKSSTKRASPEEEDDDDDNDAEGEDEQQVVQTSRVKRRRVIDDDDEE